MSTSTNTTTGNTTFVKNDYSKIFVYDNKFIIGEYTAGTTETTLKEGTVMGRDGTTRKVKPLVSTATDGSQYVLGVLATTITVAANATVNLPICIGGDVNENLLVFEGTSEGLDTEVGDRILGDRIKSDTLGINLIKPDENTKEDNS